MKLLFSVIYESERKEESVRGMCEERGKMVWGKTGRRCEGCPRVSK
jgi:hypothetical protein